MEDSTGDRSSRRNDSISSIMSFTPESPTWARSGNEDGNTAPSTPRDGQRVTRAKPSRTYHAQPNGAHQDHMLPQHESEQPQSPDSCQADSTSSTAHTTILQNDVNHINGMHTVYALYQLLEQLPNTEDVDLVDPYQRAALLPPITQESLAELDVVRIIANPKLRHDVNFDRELHFRPNLDGTRGKQKLKDADEYWKALIAELELYNVIGSHLRDCTTTEGQQQWAHLMQASQIRMPGMFETIKGILKSLVPAGDQAIVDERLEVPMIMQQISNGVFDLMDLALWLANLLKAHCAPMRDDWVDQMVTQTRRGVEEGCQKRIVLSLRQTLGILEAMKLDVANHQIRHLRGMLIEDTVNFQQRLHLARMHQGRVDLKHSRTWYKREATHVLSQNPSANPLQIFSSAFFRLLFSQSSHAPETFQLDMDRIRVIRGDLTKFVQLELCSDILSLLIRDKVNSQVHDLARSALRASVTDILGEGHQFVDCAGNIAAEIVRTVLTLEGSKICYDSEMADSVEERLQLDLRSSSLAFTERAQSLMADVLPKFVNAMEENAKLTTLALHEAMLPAVRALPVFLAGLDLQANATVEQRDMENILRRATHVGVINWKIWSLIAYNLDEEDASSFSNGLVNDASHADTPTTADHAASLVSLSAPATTQADPATFRDQPSEPSDHQMLDQRPPERTSE